MDGLITQLHPRVLSFYKKSPITDFASITPATPLEDLNLNWREKDLPERVRTKHVHRLHPYLGKFIPQLVEVFLRKYRPKLVYDPFCGSGTTLVEANALGINSIGCDISAFNVLLSRVKLYKYDIELLRREVAGILDKLLKIRRFPLFANSEGAKIDDTENEYLRTWFAPQARKELLYFKSLIPNYKHQGFLKVVLSRAARSARLTTHYDLDFPQRPQTEPYYCRKHGRICKPVEEAYKFLTRYGIDALNRVGEFSRIRTDASTRVIHEDSREVKLPTSIDCVITSPPYVGLIDYHEQHKYAFELLDLPKMEEKEIGKPSRGRDRKAKEEYIREINKVFLHTKKFMTKDAVVVIVVHDRDNLYNPESVGFKWEGKIDRHVNRRTGMRDTPFFESVLIWRKV
ncbi:MAG: DNA methyltransferase [Patescibacteria group bacterium]